MALAYMKRAILQEMINAHARDEGVIDVDESFNIEDIYNSDGLITLEGSLEKCQEIIKKNTENTMQNQSKRKEEHKGTQQDEKH